MVNEDYFEAFYRSQGYEIISPEKYSIRDQVAIMAGAKEVELNGKRLSIKQITVLLGILFYLAMIR